MSESRFHPILLLLSSNLLGAAVGGAFFIAASRRLSIEDMGRYAVAISAQWVAFGLIGTGLAIATLRVARDQLSAGDHAGAAGVVANGGLAAAALALVAAAACYSILRGLEVRVTIEPRIAGLAVLWAGSRALLDCLRSGLLAQQDFMRAARLTAFSAATGLTALIVALGTGSLTVGRLISAHVLGLFTGSIASLWLLAPLARHGVRRLGSSALFRYARWPALSEGTRLLQVNLGAPLLAFIAGPGQAGVFGMGRYPAYVFDVIAVTLYQYWLTKAVQVPHGPRMRGYLQRQFRFALGLGAAMVIGAVAAQPLLSLLGENFRRAGLLFVLCAIDFAIVLLIRPLESVFHGLGRPRLELLQRCATLPVLITAAFLLAPRWGAVGMGGAHIIASLVSLGVGTLLVRRALRGKRAG